MFLKPLTNGLRFPCPVAATDTGAPEAVVRAAALLESGRLEDARALLQDAPDSAETQSLRAVIALGLNLRDDALRLAETAVATDARSTVARRGHLSR